MRGAALAFAALAALASSATAPAAGATRAPPLYQPAQAASGAKQYLAHCAACHGVGLDGGAAPALSGPGLRARIRNTRLTVGDMFSIVALQMPLNDPASLTHEQYVEILAYILQRNGSPSGSTALTYAQALRSAARVTSRGGK